jgi:hypothetical protein
LALAAALAACGENVKERVMAWFSATSTSKMISRQSTFLQG